MTATKKEPMFMEQLPETFFDEDYKKCFKNAIDKKIFTRQEADDPNNYIMYMCSNKGFDYFKSKLTKHSYTVKRS